MNREDRIAQDHRRRPQLTNVRFYTPPGLENSSVNNIIWGPTWKYTPKKEKKRLTGLALGPNQ